MSPEPVNNSRIEVAVRRPGHPERRMVLAPGVTNLGRAENNEVVLPDIGVSRRHARILVETGGVYIEDLGSGNGTFYRGRRVQRQAVQDGDEVLIDPYVLAFAFKEAEGPTPVPPPSELDERTARIEDLPADQSTGTQPQARLIVLSGQRLEPVYPLKTGTLTMGRSEGRDIVLFDPAASRTHCEVRLTRNGYLLVDQGAANGTFVNTRRARERLLEHGDRIRIGATEFLFEMFGSVTGGAPAASGEASQVSATAPAERAARRSQGTSVLSTLLYVAAFIAVVFMLMAGIVAVALGMKWFEARKASTSAAADASGPSASDEGPGRSARPPDSELVAGLLAEGKDHFARKRYLDAAAAFYRVVKIDPEHEVAERMGYVACEYIAIGELRTNLLVRALSEDEKRDRMRQATALSDRALQGSAPLADAESALELGLVLVPDDKNAGAALRKVRQAMAAEAARKADEHKARVGKLYEAAKKELAAGDKVAAVAGFEKVMVADAERRTEYYDQAKDEIRKARGDQ